jgi:hypothetical protein
MDNGHARDMGVGGGVGSAGASDGDSVVCGWVGVSTSVGEMDAGDTSESEEVRLVRLGAGTDEADYAGCDSPLVQGGGSIVLNEWDGGKDGVSD